VKRFGLASVVLVAACVHNPPRIDGVAPTPATSSSLWQPSSSVVAAAAQDKAHSPVVTAVQRIQQLFIVARLERCKPESAVLCFREVLEPAEQYA